jgi:hypothetical protein
MTALGVRKVIENEDQVLAALHDRLPVAHGHGKRLSYDLGVSQCMLSQVLSRRKKPTEAMGLALGFRKVTRWERIESQ